MVTSAFGKRDRNLHQDTQRKRIQHFGNDGESSLGRSDRWSSDVVQRSCVAPASLLHSGRSIPAASHARVHSLDSRLHPRSLPFGDRGEEGCRVGRLQVERREQMMQRVGRGASGWTPWTSRSMPAAPPFLSCRWVSWLHSLLLLLQGDEAAAQMVQSLARSQSHPTAATHRPTAPPEQQTYRELTTHLPGLLLADRKRGGKLRRKLTPRLTRRNLDETRDGIRSLEAGNSASVHFQGVPRQPDTCNCAVGLEI
jgi:hypothetical protein